MGPWCILIFLVALLAVVFVLTNRCGAGNKDKYRYMGSVYNPNQGGGRAEPNEECLQFPGYRHCMLTDGTFGTCVLDGLCVASMMVDIRQEDDEVHRPLCTEPTFKEGCGRWCKCQQLLGNGRTDCVDQCESWFSPLP